MQYQRNSLSPLTVNRAFESSASRLSPVGPSSLLIKCFGVEVVGFGRVQGVHSQAYPLDTPRIDNAAIGHIGQPQPEWLFQWAAKSIKLTAMLILLAAARLAVAQAPTQESLAPEQPAQAPAAGEKWVRLLAGQDGKPTAMQTAVVRYSGPAGSPWQDVRVDLIGAVHVGDAAYYAELNRRFRQYQALLYELVAAQGTVVQRGTKASNRSPLGALQTGMADMLELEHQLEQVDYTRPNFVHADMTPREFAQSMQDRGESVLQMIFKLIGQSAAAQQSEEAQHEAAQINAEILVAFFSKDRSQRLKRAMARQFNQMEHLLTSLGGEEGSTLITERNKKALRVLKRELAAGKTKLGVFYGAGHMADMHQRLVEEFGLTPQSVEWITAWDMRQ